MSQNKGWMTNLFSFFSYIRIMNQYYLGLLLKYEAKLKYGFREPDLDVGFDFVIFPVINRKFS